MSQGRAYRAWQTVHRDSIPNVGFVKMLYASDLTAAIG